MMLAGDAEGNDPAVGAAALGVGALLDAGTSLGVEGLADLLTDEAGSIPAGEADAGEGAAAAQKPAWPGSDATQGPSGTEWRGQPESTPGSAQGNYYNPSTGESFHPDLNHPEPIGPH